MKRLLFIAVTALTLSACAAPSGHKRPSTAFPLAEGPGWRSMVSTEDAQRITHLPENWHSLLTAIPHRFQPLITREGDLLAPDAGRDHPTLPPGSYRCRLVKLTQPAGPKAQQRELPVKSFPDYFCYIRGEENNELSFTKQTGTELPSGSLNKDGDRRMVLVGARQREAGDISLAYGTEPDRNVVGVVERIGPFRWRLVLPWRGARQGLDIYELTPVPIAQQAVEPRTPQPPETVVIGASSTRKSSHRP